MRPSMTVAAAGQVRAYASVCLQPGSSRCLLGWLKRFNVFGAPVYRLSRQPSYANAKSAATAAKRASRVQSKDAPVKATEASK